MLLLKPYAHETIWGGSRLREFCDSDSDRIGHLYSLYDDVSQSNEILNGIWRGKTLHDYFQEVRQEFGMGQYSHFPLIVAMVEAKESLSIQVHPDDEVAKLLTGGRGKHESWYFLETPAQGYLYCGCDCDSLSVLKDSILRGDIDQVTTHQPVKQGDYVYVEGGTLHAMTAGSFVYEIEENAGATYRFYDFDRIDDQGEKRPLHIQEAFFSIQVEKKAKMSTYGQEPMVERLYQTQYLRDTTYYQNKSDTLEVMTLLSGSVALEEGELQGYAVQFGTSLVLEPEEAVFCSKADWMVARPLG